MSNLVQAEFKQKLRGDELQDKLDELKKKYDQLNQAYEKEKAERVRICLPLSTFAS